ncbi:MAG: hypothetical protein ACXAB7_11500 [Candidatus Kariarchaeaceae archaeon]|jgi:hypothetical protein
MAQSIDQPYPLGRYSANKVGNGLKVSVPPKILKRWGISNDEKRDPKFKIDVYLYAEKRNGKTVLVASQDPFSWDWLEQEEVEEEAET